MSGTVNRASFPERSPEDKQRKMFGETEAELEQHLVDLDDAERLLYAMGLMSDAQEAVARVAEKHGLGPVVVHEERKELARQALNRAKYIVETVRAKLKNGVLVTRIDV